MSIENKTKLNQLLSHWKDGLVMTSRWLSQHGYSFQLIKKYAVTGWVSKLGQGAYTKLNDSATWAGGVHALQYQLKFPVHVGGISALELHGLAQYLVLEKGASKIVTLYNTTGQKKALPKWFITTFKDCDYRQHRLFKDEIGLQETMVDGIMIQVASPERAILEVLTLIPYDFDYHHASELSENLQLLRPDLMQTLLQQCLSVKVKRLFLYLAESHQLACFSHLSLGDIDLGKGKRLIEPGGQYIAKYKLSVPAGVDDV